jgi:hypothetical protein
MSFIARVRVWQAVFVPMPQQAASVPVFPSTVKAVPMDGQHAEAVLFVSQKLPVAQSVVLVQVVLHAVPAALQPRLLGQAAVPPELHVPVASQVPPVNMLPVQVPPQILPAG